MGAASAWLGCRLAARQPEDELLEPVDDELPLELDEEPPAA